MVLFFNDSVFNNIKFLIDSCDISLGSVCDILSLLDFLKVFGDIDCMYVSLFFFGGSDYSGYVRRSLAFNFRVYLWRFCFNQIRTIMRLYVIFWFKRLLGVALSVFVGLFSFFDCSFKSILNFLFKVSFFLFGSTSHTSVFRLIGFRYGLSRFVSFGYVQQRLRNFELNCNNVSLIFFRYFFFGTCFALV